MIGREDVLAEIEVHRRVRDFLLMKYPESKVIFSSTQLATKEDNLIFLLAGTIEMKLISIIEQLTFRSHPNRYFFNVELDAKQGVILSYELR